MSECRISIEMLNAYVDGELDARAAADVARAVASDPAVAAQVAMLSKLRAALRDSVETPDLAVPPARGKSVPARKWLMAACFALIFVGMGAALERAFQAPPAEAWLTPVLRLHAEWTPPAGGTAPALIEAAFADAYIPDLTSAKLTLAHRGERALAGGGTALVLGYTGTRGCRVTMIAAPALASFDDRLTAFASENTVAYAWRAGALDYAIVAEGMDAGRFRLIAEAVHEASLERLGIDEETRVALAESRDRAVPCTA